MNKTMKNSNGYKSLRAAIDRDISRDPKSYGRYFHDYEAKFDWVIARALHYAEKTGADASEILCAWEDRRDYWYMNYYQECNQPEIKTDGNIQVFESVDALKKLIGKDGFRCPNCHGVTGNPTDCDNDGCDWKSYGLFRFGLMNAFVVSECRIFRMFMPVSMESNADTTIKSKPNNT